MTAGGLPSLPGKLSKETDSLLKPCAEPLTLQDNDVKNTTTFHHADFMVASDRNKKRHLMPIAFGGGAASYQLKVPGRFVFWKEINSGAS